MSRAALRAARTAWVTVVRRGFCCHGFQGRRLTTHVVKWSMEARRWRTYACELHAASTVRGLTEADVPVRVYRYRRVAVQDSMGLLLNLFSQRAWYIEKVVDSISDEHVDRVLDRILSDMGYSPIVDLAPEVSPGTAARTWDLDDLIRTEAARNPEFAAGVRDAERQLGAGGTCADG